MFNANQARALVKEYHDSRNEKIMQAAIKFTESISADVQKKARQGFHVATFVPYRLVDATERYEFSVAIAKILKQNGYEIIKNDSTVNALVIRW